MDINKVLNQFANDIKTKCGEAINSIDSNKIKEDYRREAIKYFKSLKEG